MADAVQRAHGRLGLLEKDGVVVYTAVNKCVVDMHHGNAMFAQLVAEKGVFVTVFFTAFIEADGHEDVTTDKQIKR